MIPVKVDKLLLSNVGFVVLLKGEADKRSLPIFIGAAEAQAIAARLNGLDLPRPMTHDLLKNALDFLECRLKRVEVCDLVDGTFFARLILERDGREMPLDSRPSDAIAVGLRCAAPMFVAEKVMDEAGRVFTEEDTKAAGAPGKAGAEKKPRAAKAGALDALRKRLERVIREERYEEAARLRDEIKRLESAASQN
jgi:bifunctional DNase/RNase